MRGKVGCVSRAGEAAVSWAQRRVRPRGRGKCGSSGAEPLRVFPELKEDSRAGLRWTAVLLRELHQPVPLEYLDIPRALQQGDQCPNVLCKNRLYFLEQLEAHSAEQKVESSR